MVDVADFLAGVDVDEDGFYRSLFSYRFPIDGAYGPN